MNCTQCAAGTVHVRLAQAYGFVLQLAGDFGALEANLFKEFPEFGVFGMLRAVTPGRLFVVFGCGGNRDRTKRPLMTAAVQEYADFAWATADNPRSEALSQIFADMKTGVTNPAKISFIEDRRHAISVALDMAREGDCLLIAGKGHETYQEFADTIVPFDDRQVVRELIGIKSIKPA